MARQAAGETAPDTRYNGWTNYETWAVKLWIDNERAEYDYWREQTRFLLSPEGYAAHKGRFSGMYDADPLGLARLALVEQLKEHYDDSAPDLGATVWADLLGAALGEVSWREIAEDMLTEGA